MDKTEINTTLQPSDKPWSALLIQRGTLVDGTGKTPEIQDVLVLGDRIAAVGHNLECPDRTRILDAREKIVCPGFIDVHGHSDYHVLLTPDCESKIHQGITSEVTGNCGLSPAPLNERNRSEISNAFDAGEDDIRWDSFGQYLEHIRQTGIAMNIVPLVGHGTLRAWLRGYKGGRLSEEEIRAVCRETGKAAEEGARGISTGLEYPPGCFADVRELAELVGCFRSKSGIYASHIRDEGKTLLQAIDEAIEVARRAEVRLLISHLKVCGRRFWGQVDQAIEKIERAEKDGVLVRFDRYPYLAVSTHLAIFLPPELWEGGTERFIERIREDRARWEEHVRNTIDERTTPEEIWITDSHKTDDSLQGKSLQQIADERAASPASAAIDLILESQGHIQIAALQMNEDETERILAHPFCYFGSDAAVYAPDGVLGERSPHPRAYGSTAHFLGDYILNRKIDSLENAIGRMTAAPAEFLSLSDRGRIKKGAKADIVVFDPRTLKDNARYGDPHHYPTGIDWVIVNGKLVINDGRHTGERPGKVV